MSNSDPANEQFLALYCPAQRRIYAYLFTLVRNHADVEDLLQKTSIILWQKFDQYESGTDFVAWACRIAQFEARNFLRAKSSSSVQLSDVVLDRLADTHTAEDDSGRGLSSALEFCLGKLSDKNRHLVKLCYAGTHSVKEIAAQAGRPVGSVYVSLNRIRHSLRECIERSRDQSEDS